MVQTNCQRIKREGIYIGINFLLFLLFFTLSKYLLSFFFPEACRAEAFPPNIFAFVLANFLTNCCDRWIVKNLLPSHLQQPLSRDTSPTFEPEKRDPGPVFQWGALFAGAGFVLLLVSNIWLSVGAVGVSLMLFARGAMLLWKR